MNLIDATCTRCGKPMRWLIGSPRNCCNQYPVQSPGNAVDNAPAESEATAMGRAAWEQHMMVAGILTLPVRKE